MERAGILKNKLFLYLTEFFAGMSVMAVELGASRLLAPYFSSSQIVWTIIIGTIMIAMALGNIYGGKSADKSPNPDKLYGRILIAACWIALIPVVGKYLILGISALLIFTVSNNFLYYSGILCLHDYLRVSLISAGHGDSLPGEVHCGQPGRQRTGGGNSGCL